MRKDDPKRGTNDRTQEQERYDRTLKTVIMNGENELKHSGFLTKKESMEARESSIFFFFEYSKTKTKPFNSKPTILCPEKAPFGDKVETGVFLGEGNRRGSAASRTN